MNVNQTLNRFYVNDMEQSLKFYENMLHAKCKYRFTYPEMNLELAQIEDILILCGSDEALAPFRATQATFLVDSIREFKDFLLTNGASIIRDIKEVPTGWNMTVRHLDGTIVEYVEHKVNLSS